MCILYAAGELQLPHRGIINFILLLAPKKRLHYNIFISSEISATSSFINMIATSLTTADAGSQVTCFRMRSNMRMKQPRFMSSSSQSRSRAQWPVAWPRFLKGLQRRGLRNGLRKGLGKGLRVLCWPRRPGSDTTLTCRSKDFQPQVKDVGFYTLKMYFFWIINISLQENVFSIARP